MYCNALPLLITNCQSDVSGILGCDSSLILKEEIALGEHIFQYDLYIFYCVIPGAVHHLT